MDAQFATTVALPIALMIIMFGLGLSLTLDDFKGVVRFPKPIFIGLLCQMLILPVAAIGLCYLFSLSPAFAIGLMVLAASPGGATSNIFSHLAKGDVALNLTLTAINSILAAVALPLFTMLAMTVFMDSSQSGTSIGFQPSKMIEVVFLILIPTSLGMFSRIKWPQVVGKLEKPTKIFSILVLVVIIVATLTREHRLIFDNLAQVGWAVLSFNIISLALGYSMPRLVGVPYRQAIAITFEVGIHNGTLALYIALAVLGSTEFAVPAAIYSVLMYFTATAVLWLFKRDTKGTTFSNHNSFSVRETQIKD